MQLDIKEPLPETPTGSHRHFLEMGGGCATVSDRRQDGGRGDGDERRAAACLRRFTPIYAFWERALRPRLLILIGANKTKTSPFNSTGNGGVDRFNRTMGIVLLAYVLLELANWVGPVSTVHYAVTTNLSTAPQTCHHSVQRVSIN